ncbi:MAG: glutathione S-transferase [Psychroserpens sp.]|jgi:glutathione S-transferase
MMTIILEIAESLGLLKSREITKAYLASIKQRPAYKKGASFG